MIRSIAILGGGISGLTAAWYARKRYPRAKISLFEKTSRCGGVIETGEKGGFLFEKGPRTFQTAKCPALLQLIDELGLTFDLIYSDKTASIRYLWEGGKLRPIQSYFPKLFMPLLKEAFIPQANLEDESIYDYACRRLNREIAELFFDPMTLGIYAGDIRKLSIHSCFPTLARWEKENRSYLKVILSSLFRKKRAPLFTLKGGMGRLISTLVKTLDIDFYFESPIERLEVDAFFVKGKRQEADLILSALPLSVMASLSGLLFSFQFQSIWVYNIGYFEHRLPKQGFGYLVPTKEQLSILGMVWDSSIFPQNQSGTSLTAMMRREDEVMVRKALRDHVGIDQEPDLFSMYVAEDAIPQFEVGYQKRLSQFQHDLKIKFPRLQLLGNYLEGPSVEACVALARKI